MIPGISGSLLSEDALEHVVPNVLRGLLGETERSRARRQMRQWHAPLRSVLGPASGPRTLFDRLAMPLLSQLGYRVLPDGDCPAGPLQARGGAPRALRGLLQSQGRTTAALVVTGWGQDAGSAWRDAVRHGIGHGVRWCFCCTGAALRVVDSARTYSRRFVEFDLETTVENDTTFGVFWGLLRAGAMVSSDAGASPLLERAIAISEDHRTSVRTSLQRGVNEALVHLNRAFSHATRSSRRKAGHNASVGTFDEALIVIYRVLFLLFAEARGLVPRWHPVYRDGYTIEALRSPVEMLPRPRGLWETMQSIARLAHRGCRIGSLQVTPFNGRLFSPVESPLADSVRLDDGAVRQALLALTTRAVRGGRERIAYGDLGVEQLGGVYERVLDLEPLDTPSTSPAVRIQSRVRNTRRKATGSFYTPRSLTEYLVRRTLAPLVHGASPEQIISLRVLDPAMGSGAFLVAACRYLASAYEAALVREGAVGPEDLDERERADFRRSVAQRCLYGVDINPMAVQLGRLSLWLATLAADRPLTFLDHRLRAGNSLVGASLEDLARQPPGARRRAGRWTKPLPLFDDQERDQDLRRAVDTRNAIAVEPGNTLAEVRAKERALAGLTSGNTSLARWKEACDLWCAWWFWPADGLSRRPPFGPLLDALLERGFLPDHIARPGLEEARQTASRERFFHWTFEFPEVFSTSGGDTGTGFDAIVGNPPWEMLRGDPGSGQAAGAASSALIDFARGSGIYSLQGAGHANLYQAFLERMLRLLRTGGRLGVILPSGLATDHGASPLRRVLLEHTAIDTLISFENRDALFPIHRGLRFLLIAATTGGQTNALPCRFGVRRPESLETLPETGPGEGIVMVPRLLIEKLARDDLAIPDIRCSEDVSLLSHLVFTNPALGSADGWNVKFGRELNATDDREHFEAARGADTKSLPVVQGKQVTPFAVDVQGARLRISAQVAARLLDPDRTFRRARLAYRDVASPSNRLTLIAAIVPAGAVTTHTLFCLKEALGEDEQLFLCGMFNSFVANYVVRLQVGTHVTTAIVDRLPMPKPSPSSRAFKEMVALARALGRAPSDAHARARLQGAAARLYELDEAQFGHVIGTLPLVAASERQAAMSAFCDIVI
jgi:N-6 DNA Methylase/Eco57I restriction-modification methylase